MKIAFFDARSYDRQFFDAANQHFKFQIDYFEEKLTEKNVDLIAGHEVVCVFVNNLVPEALIQKMHESGVKLLALRSAGYNHVDLKAAHGKIKVVYVPRYSPSAVAEFAVGLMMTLNRKLHLAYARTRSGNFTIEGLMGFDMRGKTAGVIGCGKIGSVAVKILQGFGMNVLGFDVIPSSVAAAGCTYADLDTLYAKSDIITLHTPLTDQTHHMINRDSFAKMKDGVMLINTGRGGLVDTPALIQALKSKKVGSAGLDVYEGESPYYYSDHSKKKIQDDALAELLTFPNVIMTSHQAFFTQDAMENISRTTLENIREFESSRKLTNEIS